MKEHIHSLLRSRGHLGGRSRLEQCVCQLLHSYGNSHWCVEEELTHVSVIAQLRQSTVVGAHGESVLDTVRTSRGTFLRRNTTPTIAAVEARLALWSHHNVSQQEDIQILRYSNFQKYGGDNCHAKRCLYMWGALHML